MKGSVRSCLNFAQNINCVNTKYQHTNLLLICNNFMYVQWDHKVYSFNLVSRHGFIGLEDIQFIKWNFVSSSTITEDEDSANNNFLFNKSCIFSTAIEDRKMNLFETILITYAQSHIL